MSDRKAGTRRPKAETGRGPAPRPFAAIYELSSGDMLVYGGFVLVIVGVLAAAVNAAPGFLLLAVVGAVASWYFRPTLERARPQLAASSAGLYVERIGTIGWRGIRDVTIRRQALRNLRLAYLHVGLRAPLEQVVVEPEETPLPRRLTTRNWKRTAHGIEVRMHTLNLPPDQVLAAIRAFHAAYGSEDDQAAS